MSFSISESFLASGLVPSDLLKRGVQIACLKRQSMKFRNQKSKNDHVFLEAIMKALKNVNVTEPQPEYMARREDEYNLGVRLTHNLERDMVFMVDVYNNNLEELAIRQA